MGKTTITANNSTATETETITVTLDKDMARKLLHTLAKEQVNLEDYIAEMEAALGPNPKKSIGARKLAEAKERHAKIDQAMDALCGR